MPFSKISEALALLHNTELCSEEVRKILTDLKNELITPAEACFLIFEFDIGRETRATYAVCYLAILQKGSTTVDYVLQQMQQLMDLHHDIIVQERPEKESEEVLPRDVADRIQNLIAQKLLCLGENNTIFLPK